MNLDDVLLIDRPNSTNGSKDEFVRNLMSSLILTAKASNGLPNDLRDNNSFQYFRMFQEFTEATDSCSRNAVSLMKTLSTYAQSNEKKRVDLPDDLNNPIFYENLVDIIDVLLENADKHLSRARNFQIQDVDAATLNVDKDKIMNTSSSNGTNSTEFVKPQLLFLSEIDNSRDRPFRPRLQKKYHFCQPLDIIEMPVTPSEIDMDVDESRSLGEPVAPITHFTHPYEAELRKLVYLDRQMVDASRLTPRQPVHLPSHPFLYVESLEAFNTMYQELSLDSVHEIAIDLEHHSLRTFQGLTCVMQISSRAKDYVIDTLALRREIYKLGSIFDDPAVVKVMHGCDRDILWLQRDFGLYVVNCFDTFFAAKALRYPALSLAHLVRMHCGVVLNKKHQLSDWRQRPLPEEMLQYARCDTHYLLTTYDCIRRDLWKSLGKEGLENVLDASRKVCLCRYEKSFFYPLGYRRLLKEYLDSAQSGTRIEEVSVTQDCVLNRLWDWRDQTARDEDESPPYILSNSELIRIAIATPTSAIQLEKFPSARVRGEAILKVITEAISIGPTAVTSASLPVSNTGMTFQSSRPTLKAIETGIPSSNTVYTFTPAVLPKTQPHPNSSYLPGSSSQSELTSPLGHLHGVRMGKNSMSSPVMNADEIFRLAGWSTPSIFAQQNQHGTNLHHHSTNSSPLPPFFGLSETRNGPSPFSFTFNDNLRNVDVSDENKQRLAQVKDDMKNDFDRKLKKLTTGANAENSVASKDNAKKEAISNLAKQPSRPTLESFSAEEEEEEQELLENQSSPATIPQSYEDIYKISLRNKQKNKDKKRHRDGQIDSTDEGPLEGDSNISIAAFASKSASGDSFDYSSYFSQSGGDGASSNLTAVENTLDFAASVGWIKDRSQYEAIREAHTVEVNSQQPVNEEAAGVDIQSQGANNTLRKSYEKQQKAVTTMNTMNTISSSSVTSSQQQSGPNTARYNSTSMKKADMPQSQNVVKKGFDYGSLPPQQAVSVLAGKDSREKERVNGKGIKPKENIANPYLFKSK